VVAYKIIVILVNFNNFLLFWNTTIHVHFGVSQANQRSNVIHLILGFTLGFGLYILTFFAIKYYLKKDGN
jgi:hypothetical protein